MIPMKGQLKFIFWVALVMSVIGCAAQPKIETASDAYAQAYSEMTGAFNLLVSATTPTVPGAEPLLAPEQGRAILTQLDAVKAALDAAFAAEVLNIKDAQTALVSLRRIRALIPGG